MFGDVDYNPAARYSAVPIEEQLMALGRAVEAGKVRSVSLFVLPLLELQFVCILSTEPLSPENPFRFGAWASVTRALMV